MRDALVREMGLLFGKRKSPPPPTTGGPLIQVDRRGRPLSSFDDARQFVDALQARERDQTLQVWIQGSDGPRDELWREAVWRDLEPYGEPFVWGGLTEKDLDASGMPVTKLPSERELTLMARKHRCAFVTASVRATAVVGASGETKARIRRGAKPASLQATYGG